MDITAEKVSQLSVGCHFAYKAKTMEKLSAAYRLLSRTYQANTLIGGPGTPRSRAGEFQRRGLLYCRRVTLGPRPQR